jgi:Biotin/lipoate A/B protein ligase family
MPIEKRRRRSSKSGLDLPPPFRLISLREAGDAFSHAMWIAAQEGAGTLVHVGRFDVAEFAVVLEPEEPLRMARRALYAGLVAVADALAVHAPPERPINFEWPDAILVDGALVGGARLGWPQPANEDAPPDWMVFAAMIRTAIMGGEEPGLRPLSSALEEEGFEGLGSGRLVESFSRHFMAVLDTWQAHGFGEIEKDYLARLSPVSGARRALAENGDLLLRRTTGEEERRSLVRALLEPSWLDPATGGPRV